MGGCLNVYSVSALSFSRYREAIICVVNARRFDDYCSAIANCFQWKTFHTVPATRLPQIDGLTRRAFVPNTNASARQRWPRAEDYVTVDSRFAYFASSPTNDQAAWRIETRTNCGVCREKSVSAINCKRAEMRCDFFSRARVLREPAQYFERVFSSSFSTAFVFIWTFCQFDLDFGRVKSGFLNTDRNFSAENYEKVIKRVGIAGD